LLWTSGFFDHEDTFSMTPSSTKRFSGFQYQRTIAERRSASDERQKKKRLLEESGLKRKVRAETRDQKKIAEGARLKRDNPTQKTFASKEMTNFFSVSRESRYHKEIENEPIPSS
jgi:hypothetical protein